MQRLRLTQRSLFAAAAVLQTLAAGVLSACGGGDDGDAKNAASPKSYYLALGDSMAYGFQPDKPDAAPPSAFDTGYVDVFAARLRKLAPKIHLINYGCPGETTVTFSRGGCPWLRGGALHDTFQGSQLEGALSVLKAHPGEVSPITLTLWGNDLAPLSEKGKGAPRAIASVASRLKTILQRIRAAAPTAVIIVTGAWNPEVDQLKRTEPLYRALDTAIARAAVASRARVANMFAVFNPPGSVSKQRARLCALSFLCDEGDVHPTDAGYRAMAGAFVAASGYSPKS
jgi:lysophospholipase L1-like esterase